MKFLTLLLTLIFSSHSMGANFFPFDGSRWDQSIVEYEETLKPSPIYEAVKNSDYSQYSEEMSRLLDGPVEDFITAISYVDKKGDSIIHQIIKAKKHQKEFSEELEALLLLMSGYTSFSSRISPSIELGGEWIKVPKMEETAIGQAILLKDREKLKTALNNLLEGPARDLIGHFYGLPNTKMSTSFVVEHIDKNYLSPSKTPQLYSKAPQLQRGLSISGRSQALQNSLKLSRLSKLAKQEENFPTYFALKKLKVQSDSLFFFVSNMAIFGVPTAVLFFIAKIITLDAGIDTTLVGNFFPSLDSPSRLPSRIEGTGQILGVPLVVGAVSTCYRTFKRKKQRTLTKFDKFDN